MATAEQCLLDHLGIPILPPSERPFSWRPYIGPDIEAFEATLLPMEMEEHKPVQQLEGNNPRQSGAEETIPEVTSPTAQEHELEYPLEETIPRQWDSEEAIPEMAAFAVPTMIFRITFIHKAPITLPRHLDHPDSSDLDDLDKLADLEDYADHRKFIGGSKAQKTQKPAPAHLKDRSDSAHGKKTALERKAAFVLAHINAEIKNRVLYERHPIRHRSNTRKLSLTVKVYANGAQSTFDISQTPTSPPSQTLSLNPSQPPVSQISQEPTTHRTRIRHSYHDRKTLPCPYPDCDTTHSCQSNLEQHVRSHTGERPYRCGYAGCGAAFARNWILTRHVLSVHQRRGEGVVDVVR